MGQNYLLSLIKDDLMYPLVKEIIKEAWELLFFAFEEFKQFLYSPNCCGHPREEKEESSFSGKYSIP